MEDSSTYLKEPRKPGEPFLIIQNQCEDKTLYYAEEFEGELKDGKPHGFGTLRHGPNKEGSYTGVFTDGKLNGQGT